MIVRSEGLIWSVGFSSERGLLGAVELIDILWLFVSYSSCESCVRSNNGPESTLREANKSVCAITGNPELSVVPWQQFLN
jgi:hypothetical protein